MIDFSKEIKKFKPSTDVADLESKIATMDLTDMRDIEVQLMKEMAEDINS